MNSSKEKLNSKWFRKRALSSLEKIEDNYWDYSDSLLLYSPEGQSAYESAQDEDSPYFRLVTKDEHKHLKCIAKNVASILPKEFEYIDLGPGTENKGSYFLKEFKNQSKNFSYIPVDVSSHFLGVAEKHANNFGISVKPIQVSFEELPNQLGIRKIPRFVSLLGLTFSNYEPNKILDLLFKIADKEGFILIDTQLSERVDLQKLKFVYQKYVAPACDEKIRLLGLQPQEDVSDRIADEQIFITCTLKKLSRVLEGKGMKVGDKIKVFQSFRKIKTSFERDLQGLDYTILDTGNSFVSAIIRT